MAGTSRASGRFAPIVRSATVLALLAAGAACTRDDAPPDDAVDTPTSAEGAPVAQGAAGTSAHRRLMWSNCNSIVSLTDEDLDRLSADGVDGFVCNVQRLQGLGGDSLFTGDLQNLADPAYARQRGIVDSRIVERAAERGMELFISFYAANADNQQTPFVEWFDDAGWDTALASIGGLAAAAQAMGMAGIGLDQELYAETGDATWAWDYPENTHTEDEVRQQAAHRGTQVMGTLLGAFPAIEILAYDTEVPDTYEEVIEQRVNGVENAFDDQVHLDFWDGMTSVEGYEAIWWLNALFYKIPHITGADWDTVFDYEYNRLASVLSAELSNWDHAYERLFASPFLWISAGGTDFETARSPEVVAEQLEALSEWGMGGLFADYAYAGINGFDYSPYADAMRAWSEPREVDDEAPSLEAGAPQVQDGQFTIRGTADDDHAVWAVTWADDRGGSGAAVLDWQPSDGDFLTSFEAETAWEIAGAPVTPGATMLTITAHGINGPSAQVQVVLAAG